MYDYEHPAVKVTKPGRWKCKKFMAPQFSMASKSKDVPIKKPSRQTKVVLTDRNTGEDLTEKVLRQPVSEEVLRQQKEAKYDYEHPAMKVTKPGRRMCKKHMAPQSSMASKSKDVPIKKPSRQTKVVLTDPNTGEDITEKVLRQPVSEEVLRQQKEAKKRRRAVFEEFHPKIDSLRKEQQNNYYSFLPMFIPLDFNPLVPILHPHLPESTLHPHLPESTPITSPILHPHLPESTPITSPILHPHLPESTPMTSPTPHPHLCETTPEAQSSEPPELALSPEADSAPVPERDPAMAETTAFLEALRQRLTSRQCPSWHDIKSYASLLPHLHFDVQKLGHPQDYLSY